MIRAIHPLFAAIALAALASPAAAAPAGTVAAGLKGVPKLSAGAKRDTSVRAIRLDTGQLLAAASGSKVKVPAGRWLALAANVLDTPGSGYAGLSHAVRVKGGKRARVTVKMRRQRAGGSRKASGARTRAAAAKPGGFILGVKRIPLTGIPNGPVDIDGAVTTEIFNRECADGSDKQLVEIRRRQDILDEIKLQNTKYFDRKSRIKAHLVDPRQTVEGSGTVVDGAVTLELRVVDVKTGKTVAQATSTGPLTDFFDLLDNTSAQLVDDLCGIKADIVFSGSGTYARDEGPEDHSEHHVRASYRWDTTYRRVDLAGTPTTTGPATAVTSDVTGEWRDDGRFGDPGPGSYSCSGPVAGYNGTFAFTTVDQLGDGGGVRLTVMPFTSAQTDHDRYTCTGLPGAPFSSFQVSGFTPQSEGIVEIDPKQLLEGPIELDVAPAAPVAPDCSDLIFHHEEPCSQTLSWSGKLTITRSPAR